jgi:hypothetical protein
MPKKKTITKKAAVEPEEQLTTFLKGRKDEHYNFEEGHYFEVSQGSLLLDLHVGKITPSVIRHTGISRGGKTSQFLEDMKQFLKAVPNSRGFWVLAEGRLSEKLKKRSGLKFVYNPEEWQDGTVFVLESNVYDLVFDTVRDLISNNPKKKRYFFVVDSSDGLKTKDDLAKSTSDNTQVGGGSKITSEFLSRVSLGMAKFGHVLGLIGQVRQTVKTNQYEKSSPKLSSSTGGHALDHYPSIFLQYEKRYKEDLIGDQNDPKGHWAKVTVIKTDNEKTMTLKYPIKYDNDGKGGSIWREYEIADLMVEWGFLTKSGAWLKLSTELMQELTEAKVYTLEDEVCQVQGMDNLRNWLEENPSVTDYLFTKFEQLLT